MAATSAKKATAPKKTIDSKATTPKSKFYWLANGDKDISLDDEYARDTHKGALDDVTNTATADEWNEEEIVTIYEVKEVGRYRVKSERKTEVTKLD